MRSKNIQVSELGRMIKQAEQKGLSATAIMRLLKLYFGTDTHSLISEWGVYMQCHFNQLAGFLKMKSPSELLQQVRQSGWFIVGECSPAQHSFYPVLWFASPLYVDEKELSLCMASGDAPEEPVSALTEDVMLGGLFATHESHGVGLKLDSPNGPVNCIINYTGKKYIILSGRKHNVASGAFESAEKPTNRKLPEGVREQIVLQFIDEVRRSEIHRPMFEGIVDMLVNPMKNGLPDTRAESFTADEAREVLRILMYCHIKPYFMDSERFFTTQSFANRVAWLQSLLFSGYGKRLLGKAKVQFRRTRNRKLSRELRMELKQRRDNRPLSEHEWTENGERFYEDSLDGVVGIPCEAPPRPSASCHWNFVSLEWYEG